MKRFVFRLQSVLKLRRHELEREQRAMARAQERHLDAARVHDEAGRSAAERAAAWIERTRRGMAAEQMQLTQYGVQQAFSCWREDERRLEEARLALEEARGRVAQAHTRVRALEKLRERAVERHRVEVQREESRELDEVAGRRRSLAAEWISSLGSESEVTS